MENGSDITIDTEDEFISSSTALSIDISNLSNSDEGSMMMEVGRYVTLVDLEVVVPAQSQVDIMVGGEMADVLLNSKDKDMQVEVEMPFPISEREVRVVFAISSLSSRTQINDLELLLVRSGNANGFVNVSTEMASAFSMDADEERVVLGQQGLNRVKVYKKNDDGTYQHEQDIEPPISDHRDKFGFSVSIDGNFLAIGAIYEDSERLGVFNSSSFETFQEAINNNNENSSSASGAVYIWERKIVEQTEVNYDNSDDVSDESEETIEIWELVYFVKPEESNRNQFFGHDVEIVEHGSRTFTLAVSNPSYDEQALQHPHVYKKGERKGTVNVYSNVKSSDLEFKQTLQVDDIFINKDDFFGNDIAMNEKHLVVGAKYEASDSHHFMNDAADNSGAVFVFSRNSKRDLFGEHTFLKAKRIFVGDRFGKSVAVDRDVIFVGTPRDASTQTGVNDEQDHTRAKSNSGAVHVFRKIDGVWAYEAFIKPPHNERNMFFGASVSAEYGVMVVGIPHEDGNAESTLEQYITGGANNSGAVFVYGREIETGNWMVLDYLKEENPQPGRDMGIAPLRIAGGEIFVTTGRRFVNF